MNRTRSGLIFLVGAAWAAMALGYAGPRGPAVPRGSSNSAVSAAPAADDDDPESVEAPPPAVVGVVSAASGQRMVDGLARTLYVFSLDAPGRAACVGACARTWRPAQSLGGKPQPGGGATAPQVGNIRRSDGSEQMTFNGYPVYYYVGDRAPADARGEGRNEFGGRWTAQPPARSGR